MTEKKIVFLNIVDGVTEDYKRLQFILSEIGKENNFEFVVAPKTIESLSIEDIKHLIEVIESANNERNKSSEE